MNAIIDRESGKVTEDATTTSICDAALKYGACRFRAPPPPESCPAVVANLVVVVVAVAVAVVFAVVFVEVVAVG
jgi:hypothetical protein